MKDTAQQEQLSYSRILGHKISNSGLPFQFINQLRIPVKSTISKDAMSTDRYHPGSIFLLCIISVFIHIYTHIHMAICSVVHLPKNLVC